MITLCPAVCRCPAVSQCDGIHCVAEILLMEAKPWAMSYRLFTQSPIRLAQIPEHALHSNVWVRDTLMSRRLRPDNQILGFQRQSFYKIPYLCVWERVEGISLPVLFSSVCLCTRGFHRLQVSIILGYLLLQSTLLIFYPGLRINPGYL